MKVLRFSQFCNLIDTKVKHQTIFCFRNKYLFVVHRLFSVCHISKLLLLMAPKKLAKENAMEELRPTRVLRPKLQVASVNIEDSDNVSPIKEKKPRGKKAAKSEEENIKVDKPKAKATKAAAGKVAAEAKAKPAPKAKKVAAKGHKLPDPIKQGEIFVDSAKKSWKVGKSLGSGGFGEVYSATDDLNDNKVDDYKYVMKVEYSTGPLFVEQHFYLRCAKPEHMAAWKKEKKIKVLGLPTFYAMKGQQEHNGNSYRFIIMTKFGQDLQKLLEEHKKFNMKNTLTIGCSLLDTLEYIHHCGYVHADLKPANVLLGVDSSHAVVNIVDFGLATKFKDTDDNHKAHKVEKKSAHNGTLIYTSVVAHRGAVTTSRICDIEILAYNLLHLITGSLPWAAFEKTPEKVLQMKEELLKDPKTFLANHYDEPVPDLFVDLFKYINSTKFEVTPDYDKLKQMFTKALQKSGLKFDGKLNFSENKSNATEKTVAGSSKAEKPKRAPAKKKVPAKKAAPPPVEEEKEDDSVEELDEEDGDGSEVHFDESALRNVNTSKRRVQEKLDVVEEDEDEEKPQEVVKEKKKRKNVKESKAEAAAQKPNTEITPSEPNVTMRLPATTPCPIAQSTPHIPSSDVPTSAMLEVLNKKKKQAPAVRTYVKKGHATNSEQEINIDEYVPSRNGTKKDGGVGEKIEGASTKKDEVTSRNGTKKDDVVSEKIEGASKKDEVSTKKNEGVLKRKVKVQKTFEEEWEEEENGSGDEKQEPKEKKKKKTGKESKPVVDEVEAKPDPQPVVTLDETFTVSIPTPAMSELMKKRETYVIPNEPVPTSAMLEVMKKRNEKKPGSSRAKK